MPAYPVTYVTDQYIAEGIVYRINQLDIDKY